MRYGQFSFIYWVLEKLEGVCMRPEMKFHFAMKRKIIYISFYCDINGMKFIFIVIF